MSDNYLYHHGVLGQHWGVRRFQNEDGSRTNLGRKHERDLDHKSSNKSLAKSSDKPSDKSSRKLTDNQKAVLKTAAAIGGTIALSYGSKKIPAVAKSYLRNNGKNIAVSVLKSTPKAPVTAIKGFNATAKVGKAAVSGGVKTGGSLMKAGGSLVNLSGRIASKALG